MSEKIPGYVVRVLERLEGKGFGAFIVGGAVRDLALGKTPLDFDVATSATPAQVQAIFDRTLTVGARFGTVIVLIDKGRVEVTTFRSDGDYADGRRPERVRFTNELTSDLSRRDFTVNAMAMDKDLNIVDPYGGMEDLKARLIRCVGDPYRRLTEDALRILRAYRFAALLDFSIEEETREAVIKCAGNMEKLSGERVMVEILKLLKSRRPEMIYDVLETGGLENWFGRIKPPVSSKLGELEGDESLRFAGLLLETGAGLDAAQNVLKKLRASSLFIEKVLNTLKCAGEQMPESALAIRRLRSRYEDDEIYDALTLKKVLLGQEVTEAAAIFETEKKEGNCTRLKDLALKGEDLKMLGFPQGPEIGRVLDFLLARVMESPEKNNKETLIALAKGFLKC